VFDSVEDAVAATGADASFVVVPPKGAPTAILEAAKAGVSFIVCIPRASPRRTRRCSSTSCDGTTRGPPPRPQLPGRDLAREVQHRHHLGRHRAAGRPGGNREPVGDLTYQALHELSQQKVGQTTCVGIGGDPVPGTSFIDCLAAFEEDPDTRAVMMIGEIGGSAEEEAAQFIKDNMSKPVVCYVAGVTAPPGRKMATPAPSSRDPRHGPGQNGGAGRCRRHGGAEPDRGRRAHGGDRQVPRLTVPDATGPLVA